MGYFEKIDVKKYIDNTYNTRFLFFVFLFAIITPLFLKFFYNLGIAIEYFAFIKKYKMVYIFFYGAVTIVYYNCKVSKHMYILKVYFPKESEYYEEYDIENFIRTPFGTVPYIKRKKEICENPNDFDSLLKYYYDKLESFNNFLYLYLFGGCVLLAFIL